MLVGVTFFLLALTSDPPPTPTPQEGQNPLPQVPSTVHFVRTRAAELRATSPDRVRCEPFPLELVQSPQEPIPKEVPAGTRIAASGHTLGLLLPKQKDAYRLSLFRRGREVGTYWLKLPEREDLEFPSVPPLTLGEEGTLVALRGRKGFAVYASGTLTTVVDEEAKNASVAFRAWEVMWCPMPSLFSKKPSSWMPGVPVSKLFKEGEEPPLWLRAELDGSRREVLARVDVNRLNPEFPDPSVWLMGIATRRDDKLWLVGLSSTELWLASPSGRILRREVLPVRLRNAADDEQASKKLYEELSRAGYGAPALTDASRPQPKNVVEFFVATPIVIDGVYARDNDLVVFTSSTTHPANAVILVPADGSEARCWTLPSSQKSFKLAVTSDELWLLMNDHENEDRELGYVFWERLLAPEKKAEKTDEPVRPPEK